MSWVCYSFIMINALGIPMKRLPNLPIPLAGRLPATREQYDQFISLLRQDEHGGDPSLLNTGSSASVYEGEEGGEPSECDHIQETLPVFNIGASDLPFSGPVKGADPDDTDSCDSESSCRVCTWHSRNPANPEVQKEVAHCPWQGTAQQIWAKKAAPREKLLIWQWSRPDWNVLCVQRQRDEQTQLRQPTYWESEG